MDPESAEREREEAGAEFGQCLPLKAIWRKNLEKETEGQARSLSKVEVGCSHLWGPF